MATLTNQERPTKNKIPPLQLVFALDLLLACFVFLPASMNHPRLAWSIVAAAVALLVALFLLRRQVARTGRVLFYEFAPKPVHYVQLTMHSCIYAYWAGIGAAPSRSKHGVIEIRCEAKSVHPSCFLDSSPQ